MRYSTKRFIAQVVTHPGFLILWFIVLIAWHEKTNAEENMPKEVTVRFSAASGVVVTEKAARKLLVDAGSSFRVEGVMVQFVYVRGEADVHVIFCSGCLEENIAGEITYGKNIIKIEANSRMGHLGTLIHEFAHLFGLRTHKEIYFIDKRDVVFSEETVSLMNRCISARCYHNSSRL